jgi:hypothetical protein
MPTSSAAGVLVDMLRQQSEQGRPRSSPEDAPPQAAQGEALRPLGGRLRAYGIGLRLRSLRLLFDRLAGFCGPEPVRPFSCTGVHLHPAPQYVVLSCIRRAGNQWRVPARWVRTIQDIGYELRGTPLPRNRVHKSKKKADRSRPVDPAGATGDQYGLAVHRMRRAAHSYARFGLIGGRSSMIRCHRVPAHAHGSARERPRGSPPQEET